MLDAPALAGSGVSEDMWREKFIGQHPSGWGYLVDGSLNSIGYTSICVPGAVKGLSELLDRYGTITWAEAIMPAVRYAEDAFLVDHRLAHEFGQRSTVFEESTLLDAVRANAEASRVFLRGDGATFAEGESFSNPDYAKTLRRLASCGPDDFYLGELAERICGDLTANGSFVLGGDLRRYETRSTKPLFGEYGGLRISTSPPPHGGPTLLGILNILKGWDLPSLGHNSPEYVYRVSMAMKAAFKDRNAFVGDPEFVNLPLDDMLSEERASAWREKIERGERIEDVGVSGGPPNTSHVSVVDSHGNCVALTTSLGSSSGIITPGLGFLYNNSMVNFHPLPGSPNSIAPGKGRATGMSPTILYRDGEPVLVVGAPGGNFIITSVLQVLLNILDFGMSTSDAVLAPRFDCQEDVIRCHIRIPEYVCQEVRKKHPIERLPLAHGGMGLVHAIRREPASGQLQGGTDAGADGMALSV
jgi:gamma-glutamyltranspeptidase/glutathione hydrolase